MVLVCPVQTQEPVLDTRAHHELQAMCEFLTKFSHLVEQFNETCLQFSERREQIKNLPSPRRAADYFHQKERIIELAGHFYRIKCELSYELDKFRPFIHSPLITSVQATERKSFQKHQECLSESEKLELLAGDLISSKSEPIS
jgi:hypothetical protein